MDMNNQIKTLRKSLGLNQTDFAKQIGLTQTSLTMIESGKRTLTERNIKIICSTFNVNESWIRDGEGDMFKSSPYEKEFVQIFGHLTPETQQYLLLMAKELLNTQQKLLFNKDKKNNKHDL